MIDRAEIESESTIRLKYNCLMRILEKYEIISDEDLDMILNNISPVRKENLKLKQELAELKQKAIVPKFEPFQKIYVIIYGDNKKCSVVQHIYSGYMVNYCARERIWIQCTDSDKDYMFSNCFATKEEAEQKFAEIRGKDE